MPWSTSSQGHRLAHDFKRATILVAISICLAALTITSSPELQSSHLVETDMSDQISIQEAMSMDGILWVDAREREAYVDGHIPSAVLLNETEFETGLPLLLDQWHPGQTIIAYCGTEQCDASAHVAKRLKEAGIEDVFILQGGWDAWKSFHQTRQGKTPSP